MAGDCLVASPTASPLGPKGLAAAPGALGSPTLGPALPKTAAIIDAVRRLPTDLDRFLFLRRVQ